MNGYTEYELVNVDEWMDIQSKMVEWIDKQRIWVIDEWIDKQRMS